MNSNSLEEKRPRPCDDEIEESYQKKLRECDDEMEESYQKKLREWDAVRKIANDAMGCEIGGILKNDSKVFQSYTEHKSDLEKRGYKFGTYNTDRSLFERLDRAIFKNTPPFEMGRVVFEEIKSILNEIHRGSKPKKHSFCMLVMMSTEYVSPVAHLMTLLTNDKATTEDLKLFWNLTDRLWCFAHPVYHLHSGWLDETCDEITKRMHAVCD